MEPEPESPPNHPGLHAVRTGLLIAASALFGGLAVVLWNRSSLSRLRQPVDPGAHASAAKNAEDE